MENYYEYDDGDVAFRTNAKPYKHVKGILDESDAHNHNSRTVVGVDVNEDNVSFTALTEKGIEDTLVNDFSEIKFERHRYFTMRKRVQNAGKDSIPHTLEGCEEQFVRARLHKVSRHIVEWSRQFKNRCIVFEELKLTDGEIFPLVVADGLFIGVWLHHPSVRRSFQTVNVGTLPSHRKAGVFAMRFYNYSIKLIFPP